MQPTTNPEPNDPKTVTRDADGIMQSACCGASIALDSDAGGGIVPRCDACGDRV